MKRSDLLPFVQALRAIRRKNGLTQEELASRLGISRKTYSAFETTRWWPQPRARADLVKRLHELDPEAASAFAQVMGGKLEDYVQVAPGTGGSAGSPLEPNLAKLVFDSAVLGVAEQLDISPRVIRPVLAAMLDRLVASGMPLSQVAGLAKAALAAPLAATRDKA